LGKREKMELRCLQIDVDAEAGPWAGRERRQAAAAAAAAAAARVPRVSAA
jgi:hypothetical protein